MDSGIHKERLRGLDSFLKIGNIKKVSSKVLDTEEATTLIVKTLLLEETINKFTMINMENTNVVSYNVSNFLFASKYNTCVISKLQFTNYNNQPLFSRVMGCNYFENVNKEELHMYENCALIFEIPPQESVVYSMELGSGLFRVGVYSPAYFNIEITYQ